MEGISNPWWAYVALGVCAGLLSGTLGLGSGTILIPALVLVLGFPQKSAQGTALAVMVPMVLVGALRYRLAPEIEVNMTYVGLVALGAVGGAFIGVELARYLPAAALRRVFAVFIVVVGIRMAWPAAKPQPSSRPVGPAERPSHALHTEKGEADVDR